MEDNFLKIIFDVIPLIFPLWPAEKTWLQLSLGNLCTLYNFVYIIIHITSNADALWACHTVFLKHRMTSPKNICVWEANHSYWNLKNPLAIYFFSLHTAHNKETSERDCLVWMYCPNKTCHYRKVSKTRNSNVFIEQQNVPCLLKLLINTFNQTFSNITWCSETFNLLKTK